MSWRPTTQATSPRHEALDAPVESRPGRSWWPATGRRRAAASVPPAAAIDLREVADMAVGAFRNQVLGSRCGHGPDRDARVRVVLGLPMLANRADGLEVWVLLGDIDEERLPAHWDPTQVLADVHLTSWALLLRGALVSHLTTSHWPDPYQVTMRIDAADRVERRGGRAYLLGSLAA